MGSPKSFVRSTVSLTIILSLALAALPLRAQTAPVEMVIRMNVQPMAAPKPALRYLLLPELRELTSGNPIPAYLACMLDQDFTVDRESLGRGALLKADKAARMDKPDWQLLEKLKTDGYYLLLPDVQKMRALATGLKERFLAEVADRRFDDAIVTAKTMFALSRHMGEHPTLIGDLVAIAIATIAIGPLEEMLAQPGCPNLYWALTNLPSPLITIDRGLEGERVSFDSELRGLSDTAPMSRAQLKKLIDHINELISINAKPTANKIQQWLDEQLRDPAKIVAARNRLVEVGLAEERLLHFPPEQILLLDQKRDCEECRDEAIKLMKLPTWQALELLKKNNSAEKSKENLLFQGLVPALEKVRLAQGRVEQRIDLLRHVEAIRLYAAEHGGKPPEKLADITVPLPVDPFTGKPFRYSLEGGTAHLRGTPPAGLELISVYNLHYEITVRDSK